VHRMSLLAHFDRVVLMVGGEVVDAGSAGELLARQPLFRTMVGRHDEAGAGACEGLVVGAA